MNSKRSIWKLLLGGASVGLFVTNCTIQAESDKGSANDTGTAASGNISSGSCKKNDTLNGCDCPGKLTGYQVCGSDGTYAPSCTCPQKCDLEAIVEQGTPARAQAAARIWFMLGTPYDYGAAAAQSDAA